MFGGPGLLNWPSSIVHRTLLELERRVRRLEGGSASNFSLGGTITAQHSNDNPLISQTNPPSESQPEDEGFIYGPTSNSAFIQHVTSVAENGSANLDETVGSTKSIGFPHLGSASRDFYLKELVLPPRQLADTLIQCYWSFLHPLLPILHQPSVQNQYRMLWQPLNHDDCADGVFYSTLNMVWALGCQRSESFSQNARDDLANEFYKRSLRLVSLDTLDTSSLAVVQLLLLRALYLLYTSYTNRCWIVVSAAIRVAQAMGLNSVRVHCLPANQLGREMRRRVWHSCVSIERYGLFLFPLRFSIYSG